MWRFLFACLLAWSSLAPVGCHNHDEWKDLSRERDHLLQQRQLLQEAIKAQTTGKEVERRRDELSDPGPL